MIENREKASKATILLVFLIGFCVLFEQCKRISFPSSSDYLDWVRLLDLILLGAVLFRLPYRDHRWYFVLILAVILIIATSWLRSPSVLSKTRSNFSRTALVLLLCPAVGILVQGRSLKTFLKVLTAAWTIINVVLCIIGIYAMIRNIQIISYNGKYFIGLDTGIHYTNLLLLWDSNPNVTGILLALSIMVSYVGAAISEKKGISALYLIAAFLMLICLAMTSCRTGIVSVWIGSGVALAAIFQKPLIKLIHTKWLRWPVTIMLVIVITVFGMLGTEGVRRGFKVVLHQGGVLVQSAKAEAAVEPESETAAQESEHVAERDFFSSSLSGREALWRNALKALKMKPSLLLTGTSIYTTMDDLAEMVPVYGLTHLHNEFLQILVSTGIIGVLLFIAFLYYVFRTSFRLFSDTERPLWERLLFLPFLCIFLIDQVEALRINSQMDLLGLMMIYTGAAIEISRPWRKRI